MLPYDAKSDAHLARYFDRPGVRRHVQQATVRQIVERLTTPWDRALEQLEGHVRQFRPPRVQQGSSDRSRSTSPALAGAAANHRLRTFCGCAPGASCALCSDLPVRRMVFVRHAIDSMRCNTDPAGAAAHPPLGNDADAAHRAMRTGGSFRSSGGGLGSDAAAAPPEPSTWASDHGGHGGAPTACTSAASKRMTAAASSGRRPSFLETVWSADISLQHARFFKQRPAPPMHPKYSVADDFRNLDLRIDRLRQRMLYEAELHRCLSEGGTQLHASTFAKPSPGPPRMSTTTPLTHHLAMPERAPSRPHSASVTRVARPVAVVAEPPGSAIRPPLVPERPPRPHSAKVARCSTVAQATEATATVTFIQEASPPSPPTMTTTNVPRAEDCDSSGDSTSGRGQPAKRPGGPLKGKELYASITIQQLWRGYLVRRFLRARLHAATSLQRWFRLYLRNCGICFAVASFQRVGRAFRVRRKCFHLTQRRALLSESLQARESHQDWCVFWLNLSAQRCHLEFRLTEDENASRRNLVRQALATDDVQGVSPFFASLVERELSRDRGTDAAGLVDLVQSFSFVPPPPPPPPIVAELAEESNIPDHHNRSRRWGLRSPKPPGSSAPTGSRRGGSQRVPSQPKALVVATTMMATSVTPEADGRDSLFSVVSRFLQVREWLLRSHIAEEWTACSRKCGTIFVEQARCIRQRDQLVDEIEPCSRVTVADMEEHERTHVAQQSDLGNLECIVEGRERKILQRIFMGRREQAVRSFSVRSLLVLHMEWLASREVVQREYGVLAAYQSDLDCVVRREFSRFRLELLCLRERQFTMALEATERKRMAATSSRVSRIAGS